MRHWTGSIKLSNPSKLTGGQWELECGELGNSHPSAANLDGREVVAREVENVFVVLMTTIPLSKFPLVHFKVLTPIYAFGTDAEVSACGPSQISVQLLSLLLQVSRDHSQSPGVSAFPFTFLIPSNSNYAHKRRRSGLPLTGLPLRWRTVWW